MLILKPHVALMMLSLSFWGLNVSAQATSPVAIESVGYGGSGCPAGSMSASISPDSSAMSFLFSQYAFDVRQGTQDRRNCSLRFQVTPPVGYQLKVMTVDYRGFAALSPGAKARLSTQVLQQHEGDSRVIGQAAQDYNGAMNDNFTFSTGSGVGASSGSWTSCGGRPVIFNLTSSLDVVNRSNDVATVSIDSTDLSLGAAGTIFYLAWSKCIDGRPDPRHGGGGPPRNEGRGDRGDSRDHGDRKDQGDHGGGVDRGDKGRPPGGPGPGRGGGQSRPRIR